MAATHSSRMLILGSGPAGLAAAIYGARAGLAPIVVQGIQPGGQLTITTDVENYPGFADVIQGPWLMEQMQKQAEHVGAQMMWDTIAEVDFSRRPFRLIGDGGTVYSGDTVVIATGAQARWLGLPSEERLQGKGVSACATCDGFFYRGKKVAVIGGGNTAVEEAIYRTNHSHDVTLIHRRDSLRAEKILQDRLFANEKVNVIWDSEVVEFVGGGVGFEDCDLLPSAFPLVEGAGVPPFAFLIAGEAFGRREVGHPHPIFVLPAAVGEVESFVLGCWICPEGKLTKLTVRRGFEEGAGGLVLALADQAQPFVPAAHQGEMARAKLGSAVAALVEAVKHGDRQAAVVAVAGRDHLAVLGDGLGDPVDRAFVKRVGERRAGQLAGGVPAGGEDGVAGAQRIGRLLGQLRKFASGGDPAGFAQHLEEQAPGERGPAVAAGGGQGVCGFCRRWFM